MRYSRLARDLRFAHLAIGTTATSRATTQSSATERRGSSAWRSYRHNRANADVDSYDCVSAWNDKFIKIRMAAQARSFVEAWIDLLWPST